MARTRFDPVAHAKSMRAAGFWIDRNYDEFLQQWIAQSPDKLALLAYRSDRPEGRRFTYAELGDTVSRAAASLQAHAASGAATSFRCSCRTGGNSRSSRSPRSASALSSIR